ncbi:MAG: DCC1-like thiol-disulfide oxidoreductase family protein [Pseudomonadota bacterium]
MVPHPKLILIMVSLAYMLEITMAGSPKEFPTGNFLVYDGECPFCRKYVAMARLQAQVGPVTVISARQDHVIVDILKSKGIDLNEGIVFAQDGVIFFGAECMTRLAILSNRHGLMNSLHAWLFRFPRVAKAVYPILKIGRQAVLRSLHKSPIGD